jgi:hypothetical protein
MARMPAASVGPANRMCAAIEITFASAPISQWISLYLVILVV